MKFVNSKNDDYIKQLEERNAELEKQLIEVAESSGNCVIKQLPNGMIELNGEPIDKDSPVEYYNSSKATYGELTMYRIGKEAEQRNTKKLTEAHMEEVDGLKEQIESLERQLSKTQAISKNYEGEVIKLRSDIINKDNLIKVLKGQADEKDKLFAKEKENIKSQYEAVINELNEDVNNWQQRCLVINNIQPDGTIKTKYGELKGE